MFRFVIALFHSLACNCANVTRSKGFTYFGLQFFGECWSGVKAGIGYDHDGVANGCVGTNPDKPCEPTHPVCVGRGKMNFVYKLVTPVTQAGPTPEPGELMLYAFSRALHQLKPNYSDFRLVQVLYCLCPL